MALGYLARAAKAGLAKLGEPSLLRGVDCGKAVLARNSRVEPGMAAYSEDNYTAVYDFAHIDADFHPVSGDAFVHPEGAFVLDRKMSDNGFVVVFSVLPAA